MALPKLFQRIFWHNNTTPAINEDNLNAMSKAIDDIDNRVIALGDDVMTVIPQIQAYLDQAEDLVEAMELLSENPPYIGQNGNWWVWDTNTSAFVDSGVDASISVNIADITMLAPNATPYVTNSGTDTDPIFHLFIPRGQTGNGISTIAKTATSGLVDTYTITMTDGTTSTFTVTNGAGDMNKSVYDSDNTVANAGGIKAFVNGEIEDVYEVMGQNGAVNLLENNVTTQTINGVTFTVNADKTITANGTATAYVELTLHDYLGAGGLKQNSYKITGCPNGGSEQTYQIFARSGSDHQTIYHDYGDGVVINDSLDWIKLNIKNGQTVSNLVFKPMASLASLDLSYDDYVPYAMTNKELTEDVKDNLEIIDISNSFFTPYSSDFAARDPHVFKQGRHIFGCVSISKATSFGTSQVTLGTLRYPPVTSVNSFCALATDRYVAPSKLGYLWLNGVNGLVYIKDADGSNTYAKIILDYVTS